ncbi:MAG: IS66 family transposase [Alphaproteobacteria bacterium]|nr:IS66 family transposase [Alphaproteobacteria bacterium]
MALRLENLPRDPDRLIEMVLACEGEIEALKATVMTLKTMIFGVKSERSAVIVAEQMSLGLDSGETLAAKPPPANDDSAAQPARTQKVRRKAQRNIGALPEHLPRVEQIVEPETKVCLCCAGRLHRIGETVSEALDRAPAVLRVLRTIRPKYACRACEGAVVQAKAPPRLIESGMASTALVAWIAAAKYAWGSTLYRQALILAGQGVSVDRQTLARWMKQAAWMAKGLYQVQLAAMHAHTRLFCDETPVRVLDPGRGRTKICQFWAHATDDRSWKGPAPPAVAYVFAGGRGKKEIVGQLAGFEGVLQVDGYAAYTALAGDKKRAGQIRLAFCLVHARRNFVKVHKTTNSPFAKEVIERIGAVYAIEKRIRGLDAEQRRAVRQAETKPLMETLKARLEETKDGISLRSTLVKAIDYALERWAGLTLFLEDGRLEPDTNVVERSIRPISIGKKNSLFCGDEGGGETWAILASLLNTAKMNGLDPEIYLTDVLERMVSGRTTNDRLHELLAWNWKADRLAQPAKSAA